MITAFFYRRCHWLNLPAMLLITVLQRTPVLRVLSTAREVLGASPVVNLLRSAFVGVGTLGTLHAQAGATTLATNDQSPLNARVGESVSVVFFTNGTTSMPDAWMVGGNIPPGLNFSGLTSPGTVAVSEFTGLQLGGTPTVAGDFFVQLQAQDVLGFQSPVFSYRIIVEGAATAAPTITSQPGHQAIGLGATATFSVAANGQPPPTVQWLRNGANAGTGTTLTIENAQPGHTGVYRALVANATGSATSSAVILGLTSATKIVGDGSAEVGSDIRHPNGNTFDQILLGGASALFRADYSPDPASNHVTRLSFLDLSNDIVQVEYSGPGNVAIVLDAASGTATPENYNQDVRYMKGHAGIVVTGATENSHLSIFSVGRGNAVNQALFKPEVDYDGLADIAFVAIQSADGKFGGLRTANASYWATRGFTGVYAPNVQFTGPVFVGDINGSTDATAVYIIGSASGITSINGGDLKQDNNAAVQVKGLTQLRFMDGITSHYVASAPDPAEFLNAKTNQAVLMQDGVDVTQQIVVNP